MDLELLRVAEVGRVVPGAPVGLVVNFWVMETVARGSHPVVFRLVVLCCFEHSTSTISTTANLHSHVLFWNQLSIETENIKTKPSFK